MNIDDVNEDISIPEEEIPQAIFARQLELMTKYHHIEKASGLMQTEACPVNMDTARGQARLKDFMWRITEELMESMEAAHNDHMHHAKEEWADALHFMVELCILSGRGHDIFPHDEFKVRDQHISALQFSTYWTVYQLGLAANCLKMKPWKQTAMLTDSNRYHEYLEKAFHCLIILGTHHGMTLTGMAGYYFKKSRVNQFRQRSQY